MSEATPIVRRRFLRAAAGATAGGSPRPAAPTLFLPLATGIMTTSRTGMSGEQVIL